MKNCNLVAYLLLASAVSTFSTSVVVEADTLGKGNLISQSLSQLQLENQTLEYQTGFAAYAIHRARKEGKISIDREGGTFIVGDMKINVTADITQAGASSIDRHCQQLYSSFITITFLKMSRPLSVTFQPKGFNYYALYSITYKGGKPILMCCNKIYTP